MRHAEVGEAEVPELGNEVPPEVLFTPPTARAAAMVVVENIDVTIALGALMATLHPNHALVVATRLALEQHDVRRAERRAIKEVHEAIVSDPLWRGWDGGRGYAASWIPRAELERRRGAPGPGLPRPTLEQTERIRELDEAIRDGGAA